MRYTEPKYKFQNILLVDDDQLDNFINSKIIEATHFSKKVCTCTSGKSAIEFLNNIISADSKFHNLYPEVVFIDLNMPLMDGFQLIDFFIKNQAQRLNNPKIVILTSSISPADMQKAEQMSSEIIFLSKPLTQAMLEQVSSKFSKFKI